MRPVYAVSGGVSKFAKARPDKTFQAVIKAGQEVEFKAPTVTQFGASVAKDMTKGWMKIAEVRMLLYVIPVGIAIGAGTDVAVPVSFGTAM